ncbi:MAG TPA: hypothetical protein VEC09_00540 [Actinomycetota bacterium]|nr:hypothetical protein [Actinomycetota bacterium]
MDRWFDAKEHPLDAEMRRVRHIILGADDRVTQPAWKAKAT